MSENKLKTEVLEAGHYRNWKKADGKIIWIAWLFDSTFNSTGIATRKEFDTESQAITWIESYTEEYLRNRLKKSQYKRFNES